MDGRTGDYMGLGMYASAHYFALVINYCTKRAVVFKKNIFAHSIIFRSNSEIDNMFSGMYLEGLVF